MTEITAPADGATVSGTFPLQGTVFDASRGQAVSVEWRSSIDGVIARPEPDDDGSVVYAVPADQYACRQVTFTLFARDDEGAEGRSDVTVAVAPLPPTSRIDFPSAALEVAAGEPLRVSGTAAAASGRGGVPVTWTSDVDGLLFAGVSDTVDGTTTFQLPGLSPGTHQIALEARSVCDGDVALETSSRAIVTVIAVSQPVDDDGDGWPAGDGDCDDDDASISPDATESCNGKDDDCDGDIDEGFDLDSDGVSTCGGDCNDVDAAVAPGVAERCDAIDQDCDGAVDEGFDFDEDGVTTCAGDCDDGDASVRPGLSDTCNGRDDDCSGAPDEAFDADGDGVASCSGDCDDGDRERFPGAAERCDGLDQDCDGEVDEGFDVDGDGATTCGGDCNDGNALIRPGAADACNGVDDDCSGLADEAFDMDQDGWSTCEDDCDDNAASAHPGATETCNGADDDCDDAVDEGFDADDDGWTTCQGDCDDARSGVRPDATDICNGMDDDCFSGPDQDHDLDADGQSTCEGDCDDADRAVYLGAPEVCDGRDQDCDSTVDEGFDADSDGWTTCAGDCDDGNRALHPEADESCNHTDDNCDGQVDEGFDLDDDGQTVCAGDCDDTHALAFLGATETCDGRDEDCDGEVDDGFDLDGDGWTTCQGDCDDTLASVNPLGNEICNLVDDNCNLVVDEGFDLDEDGVSTCGGDCNDEDDAVFPGALETCEAPDRDCDVDTTPECSSTESRVAPWHIFLGTTVGPGGDLDDDGTSDLLLWGIGRAAPGPISPGLSDWTMLDDWGQLRNVGDFDGENSIANVASSVGGQTTIFEGFDRQYSNGPGPRGTLGFTYYTENNTSVPCDDVRPIGDIDLDGLPDFACRDLTHTFVAYGAPENRDPELISVVQPVGACSQLHPVGDMNGDGWEDLAAVDPCADRGAVYLLAGPFGRSVDRNDFSARILGPANNDWRRLELASVSPRVWSIGERMNVIFADVTADGVTDLLVGVPAANAPDGAGAVVLMPGPWDGALDGASAQELVRGGPNDTVGSWLFSPGDLDQDGAHDIIYGVAWSSPTTWLSGASGGSWLDFSTAQGGEGVRDVTGDGVDDFVLWAGTTSLLYSGAEVVAVE